MGCYWKIINSYAVTITLLYFELQHTTLVFDYSLIKLHPVVFYTLHNMRTIIDTLELHLHTVL